MVYSTLLLFPSFLASAASLSFLATVSVNKKGREREGEGRREKKEEGGRGREGDRGRERKREGGRERSDREGEVVIMSNLPFPSKTRHFRQTIIVT